MFGLLNIGPWELILILVIMLIVFGPGKLPEVAQSLGKAMREFRKASSNAQRVWDEVTREEEPIKAAKSSEEESEIEDQPGDDTSTDYTDKAGEDEDRSREEPDEQAVDGETPEEKTSDNQRGADGTETIRGEKS